MTVMSSPPQSSASISDARRLVSVETLKLVEAMVDSLDPAAVGLVGTAGIVDGVSAGAGASATPPTAATNAAGSAGNVPTIAGAVTGNATPHSGWEMASATPLPNDIDAAAQSSNAAVTPSSATTQGTPGAWVVRGCEHLDLVCILCPCV